jgi:hypothetical protein
LHNILPKQEAFAMRDVDVPSMACSKQKKWRPCTLDSGTSKGQPVLSNILSFHLLFASIEREELALLNDT